METCSEDSDGSNDSAFVSGVRINGRSYEVTERKGHSALVPGVTATKTPIESISEPFTNPEPRRNRRSPQTHTEVQGSKHRVTTTSVMTQSSGK